MAQLLKPGQKIADYEVMELVGQGGMGEVYRARQVSMDRVVALKTLAPRLAKKDPIFAKRFVEEARAAGRLNHANIVAVHDVDQVQIETAEGLHPVDFFSMEFVDGESVKDVIERDGALKLPLVERVMQGMAEALIYAESQKVIHRDIKPDNIMITGEGVIKLADLGLAVQAGADSVAEQRDEHGRAKVMGTPLYMSPEQARALPLDPRSDQYSLGATLFHMLTGQPPYRGEDPRSVMRAHVFNAVPDPGALRPELPEGWCRLCRRLMAKKPEERFLNARELKYAVDAVIAGHDSDVDSRPRPAVKPISERPAALAAMVGGGVLVVVLALVWIMSGSGRGEPVRPPSEDKPDPVLEAERRVKDAIARLPGEPRDALDTIARLMADPANQPARTYLDQARAVQQGRLDDQNRQLSAEQGRRIKAKLDRVEKSIGEGAVVQALNDLPPTDAVTNDLLPVRAALLKRIETLVATRRAALAKKLAETDESGLDALAGAIATSDLPEVDKDRLRADVEARRKKLEKENASKAIVEEIAAWRTIADLADEKRGSGFDLQTLLTASQSRFNVPESLALVKAIAEIQPQIPVIAKRLADVVETTRPEVPVIIDGTADLLRLVRLDESAAGLQPVKGGETRTVVRQLTVLPIADLVAKAIARAQGSVDQRGVATYLWMCRAPEAKDALKALGDDPLAKALNLLEGLSPRPPVVAPVQRSDRRVTVKYAFNDQARVLLGDFKATGLTLAPDALVWLTDGVAARGVAPADDAKLPTLRWQARLHQPITWTVGLRLKPSNQSVLVGFEAGKTRVRLGLSVRPLPWPSRLNWMVTGKDGLIAKVGNDMMGMPCQATVTKAGAATNGEGVPRWTPRLVDGWVPVTVKLSVDDKGQVSARIDDAVAVPDHAAAVLPAKADCTPIIQVIQASEQKSEVRITDLVFEGDLPGQQR